MKKFIVFLLNIYNRKAGVDKQLMLREPMVYKTTKTSSLKVKEFKEKEPEMYKNMKAEKLYDMRQAMIDRIWREGNIEEIVEESDNELKLTIQLKIYERKN